MKTIKHLLLFAASLFTNITHAQTFACQFVASGGLDWEGKSWILKQFNTEKPFALRVESNLLTKESAASALGRRRWEDIDCKRHPVALQAGFSCTDYLGGYLIFDDLKGLGAVTQALGAVAPLVGRPRDSITISPFVCQKM
jgi:hypothetical protein